MSFCRSRYPSSEAAAEDAWILGFDRAFSKKLAARGWIGLTWPEKYGGKGRNYLDRLILTEGAAAPRGSGRGALAGRPADGAVHTAVRLGVAKGDVPARYRFRRTGVLHRHERTRGRAPTWRGSRLVPYRKATNSSCTDRRYGPASRIRQTTVTWSHARHLTGRSTRASVNFWWT